ncbi:hypothetical protein BD289DRAFT_449957 [Coniella lustricola]|uniref:WD40-repeat-containing domain protein n=1 Tax=Coniella lustricola TaxID=2025994 RepID=A0A2T3AKG3_9PEZI|nr:hypothetical protein BD289DRAFT_449957 [Coniella lustricola]
MASRRPKLSLLALSDRVDDISSPADSSTDSDSDASSFSSPIGSHLPDPETSFYKSAQWTRDGTTIITSSYDLQISTFVVPNNLLEPRDHPLTLRPHKTLQLAEPTNIVAAAPYYDLRYANTDHFLVACRDHPIQLYSALSPAINDSSNIVAGEEGDNNDHDDTATHTATTSLNPPKSDLPLGSYRLVSPTTEAYLPVHSLVWSSPGTHFYTGTRDLIAEFDITRNGAGPTTQIHTIPSRRHIRKGNGVGMRGTISALSAQTISDNDGFDMPAGLLAAGTWTRWVGLYDVHRSGECTATWGIKEAAASVTLTEPPARIAAKRTEGQTGSLHQTTKGIGGAGILQTAWSPCGRYLLLNERQSTGMLVYDVRVTSRLLSVLTGRDAMTHQRLTCDVFRGLDTVGGFEVWAGTRDGAVQVWEGVGNAEGCQWPSWDFSTTDGGRSRSIRQSELSFMAPAVGSVAVHHSGSVVATASGCWGMRDGGVADNADWSSSSSFEGSKDQNMESLVAGNRQSNLAKLQQSRLKLWSIGPPTTTNTLGGAPEAMVVDQHVKETYDKDEFCMAESPDLAIIEGYKARLLGDLQSGYDTADEVEQQIASEQASHR